MEWAGTICKVDDDKVCVNTDAGVIEIPLVKITKTKQVIDNI